MGEICGGEGRMDMRLTAGFNVLASRDAWPAEGSVTVKGEEEDWKRPGSWVEGKSPSSSIGGGGRASHGVPACESACAT